MDDSFCGLGHCSRDRDALKIYLVTDNEKIYLPRDVSPTGGETAMRAAELAYLAFGEKFYGLSDEFYPD